MESKDHLFFHCPEENTYQAEKITQNSQKSITINSITWKNEENIPHRDEDQPAVIYNDNSRFWYQHGIIHRDNEKPAIIRHDLKYIRWILRGKEHRIGGFSSINFKDNEYVLKVNDINCITEDYYFKKCREWIDSQNFSNHEKIQKLEELIHKMDIHYFDKKNWNLGLFQNH